MLLLTTDNAEGWLRQRGWVGSGPVQVRELAEGVSNVVLRVETPKRTFVVKQSRPQLRTREAWFSNLDRIWREYDVMRLLYPLLPAGTVPELLFRSDEDYAFAMSHAPEPFRNWRSVLLNGEVDPSLGEQAGRLLGTIHEATGSRPELMQPFSDRTVFEQLRVEPFYVRIQERLPDIAELVQPLIDRMRTLRLALCHGDFSPKNLLLHDGHFTLVDYETGHWGDCTMDIGFFLSHLVLKAMYRSDKRESFFELTRAFWRGYETAVRWQSVAEFQRAGIGHLAVCLLARVDGTSPAPYLMDTGQKDMARRVARRILVENPATMKEALKLANKSAQNERE
ncbi:MAG TPA: aminoglycoside phosphotransferase family protein [Gemmataceae bacterium]|nr:aminoglycoside phosphotransferase family protein [Gemmataceae bacterium]